MRLNGLNIYPAKNAVNFGNHTGCVDIGASTSLASYKETVTVGDNKTTGKATLFTKEDDRSPETLPAALAARVAEFEEQNKASILSHDPDKTLDLVIAMPGPVNAEGISLTNITYGKADKEGQKFDKQVSIQAIRNNVEGRLGAQGISLGKLVVVNDMAAAGACLLKQVQEKHPDILEPGTEIPFIYPGGGCGVGNLVVDDSNIKVKPTEKGHIQAKGTQLSVEKYAVSSPALISNYLGELSRYGIQPQIQTKKTEIVTNYEEAQKRIPNLPEYKHNLASKAAINKFAEGVAQILSSEVNGGKTKSAILTGNIVNGIKDTIDTNPFFRFEKGLSKEEKLQNLVTDKMQPYLDDVGKRLMGDGFRIISDIHITDNTNGAELLLNAKNVGGKSAWFNIPATENGGTLTVTA